MNRRRMRTPPPIMDGRMMVRASSRSHEPPPPYHGEFVHPQSVPPYQSSSMHHSYRDHYRLPPPMDSREHQYLPPPPPVATYKILCVTNLNHKISDGGVRDALLREFSRFGDISVRVCHDGGERLAYVYFRSYEEAREARHAKSRLLLFDRQIEIEPIYEHRSSSSYPVVAGHQPPRGRSNTPPEYQMNHSSRSSSYRSSSPSMLAGHSSRSRMILSHHSSSSRIPASPYDRHPPQVYPSAYEPRSSYHAPPPPYMSQAYRERERERSIEYSSRSPRGYDGYYSDRHSSSHISSSGRPHSMSHHHHPHTSSHGHHLSPTSSSQASSNQRSNSSREARKEKFPNYLHHIAPEDDDKSTRTLFIGNLEVTITEPDLKRIFERYGSVEDIDVKRPPPCQGNAYAFIRFTNLDMAHKAKVEMSGQYIGKFQCKIGYGKATPTRRIWIGGLGSWISPALLEEEFGKFGPITSIEYIHGDQYAYIFYNTLEAAQAAVQEMRGFPLGGPDKRLRIDFADTDDDDDDAAVDSDRQVDMARVTEGGDFVERERAGSAHGSWSWIDANKGSPPPHKRPLSPTNSLNNNNSATSKKHRSSSPAGSSSSVNNYNNNNNIGDESPSIRANKSLVANEDNATDSNNTNDYDTKRASNNIDNHSRSEDDGCSSLLMSNHKEEQQSNNLDRTGGHIISDTVTSINELTKCCPVAWNGALVLKNSSFSARMFLCSGDIALVDKYITDLENQNHFDREQLPSLKITQRLRLDPPKLEEVTRRMNADGIKNYCMFLILSNQSPNPPQFSSSSNQLQASSNNSVNSPSAASVATPTHGSSGNQTTTSSSASLNNNNGNVDAPPPHLPTTDTTPSENPSLSQSRPLRNLVGYLKQKDAAGVISLTDPSPGRVDNVTFMYAFPPCNYAIELLRQFSPNLTTEATLKEDFLVGIIVKGEKCK